MGSREDDEYWNKKYDEQGWDEYDPDDEEGDETDV